MRIQTQPFLGYPSRFMDMARRLRRGGLALGVGLLSSALADDPTITTQPTSQSVSLGSLVQFRVAATTTNEPVTFQWQHSGTNLPDATIYLLRLTNVVAGQAGPYQAIVSNSLGHSVTSQVAVLSIDPTFVRMPQLGSSADATIPYWIDFNRDGWLEMVITGGYGNSAGMHMLVYENNHDGTLSRSLTNTLAAASPRGMYLIWGDFDNDGDLDTFSAVHESGLASYFRNQGDGRFTQTTANRFWTANHQDVRASTAAAADIDGDGWLDLATGFWGNLDGAAAFGTNLLLRGIGAGRFLVDRTNGLSVSRIWSETMAWADYDDDGDLDLLVTTSHDTNQLDVLFENSGQGSFAPATNTVLTGMRDGNAGQAWCDYDNDGDLDVLLCNPSQDQLLFRNEGNGVFAAAPSGPVGRPKDGCQHAGWADYDNDGWMDLFLLQYSGLSRMFHNQGDGTLEEVMTGSPTSEAKGVGMAWGDYDNDGFPDLVVVNNQAPVTYLYRNNRNQTGNTNRWLKVRLIGTSSNRDGVGATIRVKATAGGRSFWQRRQILANAHQSELVAHFGLGDATNVTTIRVDWPSGNVQELTDTAPNQLLTLTEPAQIRPMRPSASLNGAVTLRSAAGSTYQWRFEGEDLVGQTNVTLVLTNLTAEQAGHYSVAVSYGPGTSASATNFTYLQVDTQFTKVTTGPIVEGNESAWACSWADYDEDGDIDLLVANGYEATGPERMGLYRNEGQGQFVRLTNEVGSLVGPAGRYGGGIWADYDNDGHLDCLVTDWTTNNSAGLLHRNLGNGTFERVTASAAPLTLAPFSVVAWGDYDNDGWLDAFNPCAYAGPGVPTNQMFHATGGGGFENVCSGAPVQERFTLCEGAAWADYDGDGDLDLLATDPHAWEANNNVYPNHFYRNDGNGVFTRITTNAVALDRGWALAPVWGDYDNDGRLDLFLSFYSGTSRLFHNAGDGVFTRTLLGPSLETIQPAWGDFDNDGDLDLYVSRGQSTATTNLFYLNNGDGTFSAIAAGSPATDVGRSMGCAWGDYDNDGYLDLVVVNTRGDQDCLYHNNGNGNHWLMVRLKGTTSNASAIGAKVRVYALVQGKPTWQLREISGSEKCQNDPRAHFGLGESSVAAKLRVEWPSGTTQELSSVPADQILTIVEPRRPVLGGGVRAADGAFVLSVAAEPGQRIRILASDNLTNWVEVGGWTGNGQTLELAPLPGARFFRAEVAE